MEMAAAVPEIGGMKDFFLEPSVRCQIAGNALIIYYLEPGVWETRVRSVELYSICLKKLFKYKSHMKRILNKYPLEKWGIEMIIPDVTMPMDTEFSPWRIARLVDKELADEAFGEVITSVVRLKTGTKCIITWTQEDYKGGSPYFDHFQSPPIPMWQTRQDVPYIWKAMKSFSVHSRKPMKRKDEKIRLFASLRDVYGYSMFDPPENPQKSQWLVMYENGPRFEDRETQDAPSEGGLETPRSISPSPAATE